MYYPDEVIEEVRMKNDIVDVISGYVKLQKKGANYFGLCPFHNEKSPSFSVSPGKQMYYCLALGLLHLIIEIVCRQLVHFQKPGPQIRLLPGLAAVLHFRQVHAGPVSQG